MKFPITLTLIVGMLSFVNLAAQDVIPKPSSLKSKNGENFLLASETVVVTDELFSGEAEIIADLLAEITGKKIPVYINQEHPANGDEIRLIQQDGFDSDEGYRLSSSSEAVKVSASHGSGIYYGGMTLIQLLLQDEDGSYGIPPMEIEDQPRFGWRVLMLDCSRTFISPRYLKLTIDRLSFYKMNILHLHLTDDQGWRLEIKKRPELINEAAYFEDKYQEPPSFEGYYTQEDIRELLDYAAKRHVEIIPEIEVPGHSTAPIHAYPELSCSGEKPPLVPFFARSKIPRNDVFCAGNEGTYSFFEDVLGEVTALFPSPYVHLGGDEVSKQHWEKCPKCQNKMKELGVADEDHLQKYIMARVGGNVQAANKRPIGWDEIIDGDADRNWVVMAWRDYETGAKAVKLGYDVVLSPTSHLYFDYNHRTTPTKKVYSYEPIPAGTTAEEEKKYLGMQANFWSHIDRTAVRMDNMIYPRALALAERAWSKDDVRDYEDFERRKIKHHVWLYFLNVQFNGYDNPEPDNPWDEVWGGP